MNFLNLIQNKFDQSAENARALSQNVQLIEQLSGWARAIVSAYNEGGKLFCIGNGGSAADAQHFTAELVSKLNRDRTPIPAIALTVDTSLLTAVGNDYGYRYSFSRQVQALVGKNDVLLAITTSGNSENILEALMACKKQGGTSFLLTGKTGGVAAQKELADHMILAPGETTDSIQEAHVVIYHTLAYLIEQGLVASGYTKYV